jgi:hypothetical protein
LQCLFLSVHCDRANPFYICTEVMGPECVTGFLHLRRLVLPRVSHSGHVPCPP